MSLFSLHTPAAAELSETAVRGRLAGHDVRVLLYDSTDSTNTEAKRLARSSPSPLPPTLIAARTQTDGRGRLGRSFYSPRDTGLYMTLLLPTALPLTELPYLTPPAAVAAARAIRAETGRSVSIKWVNDLYLNEKKVCGILAEAAEGPDGQRYVIIGWGINLTTTDFPSGLRAPAGNLLDGLPASKRPDTGLLCGAVAAQYLSLLGGEGPRALSVVHEYRSLSMLTGRRVVCTHGSDPAVGGDPAVPPITGTVVGISDTYALRIRTDGGEVIELESGEVSVRFG